MTFASDLEAYDAHLRQHGSSVIGLLQHIGAQLGGLPPMPPPPPETAPKPNVAQQSEQELRDKASPGGLHLSHGDTSGGATKRS